MLTWRVKMFKVNKITFDKINLSYLKFERRLPNSSNQLYTILTQEFIRLSFPPGGERFYSYLTVTIFQGGERGGRLEKACGSIGPELRRFSPMNFWRECTGSRKLSLPLSGRRGGRRGGFFLWKIFHRLATTPIGASNWLLNKQRDTWLTSTDCFLAQRERIGPRLGHPAVSRARTATRRKFITLEPSYGITLAIYSLLLAKVARDIDLSERQFASWFILTRD